MNSLQQAFLALNDWCNRAGIIDMPTVTIMFQSKADQFRFDREVKRDGLGYQHQLVGASPREALKPGVDLQIAGIEIVYDNKDNHRESQAPDKFFWPRR